MLLTKYQVEFENYCDCEDCHIDTGCYPETQTVDCDLLEVVYHLVSSINTTEYAVISIKDSKGKELSKADVTDLFEGFVTTANTQLDILKGK